MNHHRCCNAKEGELHHRECKFFQKPDGVQGLLTPEPPARVVEARMAPRLAAWIMEHGQHGSFCRTEFCNHCPHHPTEDRVACAEFPCSCGLAGILDDLDPSIVHQLEEDDGGIDPVPTDFGRTV